MNRYRESLAEFDPDVFEAIDRFVKVHNAKAAPFEWTKAVVHPSRPRRLYSDLCK